MSNRMIKHLGKSGSGGAGNLHAFFCGAILGFGVLFQANAVLAAPGIAVLAVDASGNEKDEQILLEVAEATRVHMAAQGGEVLSAAQTKKRMLQLGVGKGFDIEALKLRVQAAENAYRTLDFERSIDILESVVRDLASDAAFSEQKQSLLEAARLNLVKRLLGLAGNHETGRAETKLGERARAHLVDALRGNPTLALEPSRYNPRMRRLLEGARIEVQKNGKGGLAVTSQPAGATVFLEGRPIGITPLRLPETIPFGRYRFWASLGESRSVTRWLDIGAAKAEVELDLAFEGALWPAGPGLRPVKGRVINEKVAAKVGALLEVKEVILVGTANYDDVHWLYGAVYRAGDGETSRRGAVRIASGSTSPTAHEVGQLSRFLLEGDARSVREDAVPATVLPSATGPGTWMVVKDQSKPKIAGEVEEVEPPSGFLLTGIAVGTGVGLVLAVGVAATVAVVIWPVEAQAGSFDLVVR
ncbi:MAG: PEGA domain-containing protein [Deltaproteobacteria bacterium]|nr:PEGA domain-containing protein [Deltaproteobacteria bacterium]